MIGEESPAGSGSGFRPAVVVVTGGAGFIGCNMVRWLLDHDPTIRVVNVDSLTYAGNLRSLADVDARHGASGDGRYFFVKADISDSTAMNAILAGAAVEASGRVTPSPDAIVHLAAETHVDRSIVGPEVFVTTNVDGTFTLLEATRAELAARPRPFRFVNVSTDEVYGSLAPGEPAFTERHPLAPNNPYAASKAAADCIVRSYAKTFGVPCVTTRSSNNYGPYQLPEKLIPAMIVRAIGDKPLPVYGDGLHVRDWIHVEDHVAAIWAICTRGQLEDEVFNVGGETQAANVDVVRSILRLLNKPDTLIELVSDRPGHDRRYATDNTRIRTRIGWSPARTFEEGLAGTVAWYVAHPEWYGGTHTPR